MFMVELQNPETINVNDMAILLSPDNTPGMNLEEMATLTNQNPREIMTRLSNRITRHYILEPTI